MTRAMNSRALFILQDLERMYEVGFNGKVHKT